MAGNSAYIGFFLKIYETILSKGFTSVQKQRALKKATIRRHDCTRFTPVKNHCLPKATTIQSEFYTRAKLLPSKWYGFRKGYSFGFYTCVKTLSSEGGQRKRQLRNQFYTRAKITPSEGSNYTVGIVRPLLQDQQILALTNFHMPL